MVCCDPPRDVAADGDDEAVAALAWAVAHPVRVRILRILLERGSCVCGELVDELPLAQSTVSQHLKVLKQAGLVVGEVDGPRVCYCAAPERLAELAARLGALAATERVCCPASTSA